MQAKQYIKIKDKQIPVIIRNYRNSCHLKMFFQANILIISKPATMGKREFLQVIQQNEEQIDQQYQKILSIENTKMKHWYTGETILYKGEIYHITLRETQQNHVVITIQEKEKCFLVEVLFNLSSRERKSQIDDVVKKLFQKNTKILLEQRVPYWSQKTNISYTSFQVRDAVSKFGSCIPSKKTLQFSNRLIMLPLDKVDAIIVHELCHIVYPNHSKEFYQLVEKFLPEYPQINDWLKQNVDQILI